jgi:hypothetical protein
MAEEDRAAVDGVFSNSDMVRKSGEERVEQTRTSDP